jgi:hypothetical protein
VVARPSIPASGTTAPLFEISTISTGGAIAKGLRHNATVLAAVDGSLVNLNTQITDIRNGGTKYLRVNSTGTEASQRRGFDRGRHQCAGDGGQQHRGGAPCRSCQLGPSVRPAPSVRSPTWRPVPRRPMRQPATCQPPRSRALRYDLNADGSVNYASATLGQTGTATTLRNLGPGRSAPPAARPSTVPSCSRPTRPWPPTWWCCGQRQRRADRGPLDQQRRQRHRDRGSYNDVGTAFDAVSNSLANVADRPARSTSWP